MTRGFSSGAFFRRLDEKELAERTARILRDRPENLHDYQGCAGSDAGPSSLEKQPDEAEQPRVDIGPHPAIMDLMYLHPEERMPIDGVDGIESNRRIREAYRRGLECAKDADVCECGHSRRCHYFPEGCDDGCQCKEFRLLRQG